MKIGVAKKTYRSKKYQAGDDYLDSNGQCKLVRRGALTHEDSVKPVENRDFMALTLVWATQIGFAPK